jgi:hypothetical protein
MSNMHQDIDYAKEEFKKGKLAFVIVKNKEILAKSDEKGVAPIFHAANRLNSIKGASLADKIVGKAVAFLSAYFQIASVYTPVASDPAVKVLTAHNIHFEADKVVPMILNRTGDGQCPIEQMIMACTAPGGAYNILKRRFEE